LHQTAKELEPESDTQLQQSAGNLLLSISNSPDVLEKTENVVMKLTADAVNVMRCQVEQKVQYLNVDHKVQELCQQDGLAKMRSVEIQMENEGLSQEKELHLKSSGRLVLR
jgi:hypothetical protein